MSGELIPVTYSNCKYYNNTMIMCHSRWCILTSCHDDYAALCVGEPGRSRGGARQFKGGTRLLFSDDRDVRDLFLYNIVFFCKLSNVNSYVNVL